MGQRRMFFREAEDQVATEEELGEAVSPPTSVHTHFPPASSTLWRRGRERGGLVKCGEEGLFPYVLYSHSNHPICSKCSPL